MSAEREAYLAAYIAGAQGGSVEPRQTADEEALGHLRQWIAKQRAVSS